MFGQKEYDEYIFLQIIADNVWIEYGDSVQSEHAQNEANAAYHRYENASGLKSKDDY